MDFDPNNNIVKLCMHGMEMAAMDRPDDARRLFLRAWNESTNDFEKFTAAHYVARYQEDVSGKLKWLETTLKFALKIDNNTVKGTFSSLYLKIAECYEELGDLGNAGKNRESANSFKYVLTDDGPFYHGTRADLQVGDLLTAGFRSNYNHEVVMNHIYFTALVNGAGLAAALANGDGHERVYIVEPTGNFENDPNVTDKKFPGNPTRSYRSQEPLKILGEVTDFIRQTPEQLQQWREKLAKIEKAEIIN